MTFEVSDQVRREFALHELVEFLGADGMADEEFQGVVLFVVEAFRISVDGAKDAPDMVELYGGMLESVQDDIDSGRWADALQKLCFYLNMILLSRVVNRGESDIVDDIMGWLREQDTD